MASGTGDDAQDAATKGIAHLRETTRVSPAASSSNFSKARTMKSGRGHLCALRKALALPFEMELKLDSPGKLPFHALMNDQSMMTRDNIITPTPTLKPHTNDAKHNPHNDMTTDTNANIPQTNDDNFSRSSEFDILNSKHKRSGVFLLRNAAHPPASGRVFKLPPPHELPFRRLDHRQGHHQDRLLLTIQL
jgi:hypothetical protein